LPAFAFSHFYSYFSQEKRENAMTKRILQLMVVVVILVTTLASTSRAAAWSGCGGYYTVQWGDTLSGIAAFCGSTVPAIQAANPGIGGWIYSGQVLCIPTGYAPVPVSFPTYGNTYAVQQGDTLGKIAARMGISWRDILAVNPQIWNPSLIYAGQAINLPTGVGYPPPAYDPSPAHPSYPPVPDYSLSTLKINYKHGLYVRSQPGGTIIASALNKTTWYYKTNSIIIDNQWKVWAEVKLFPHVNGYTTGWILVKDQRGTYFTDPQIDR
jgi:LysM repeat protein